MAKLTPKQKKFCDSLLQNNNVSEAARVAKYNIRYAYDALQIPHIRAYLDAQARKSAKRNNIKLDEILQGIAKIARDDIGNYLEFRSEKTKVGTDEDGVAIIDYATIVDIKDSTTIDTANIKSISNTTQGFKIELYAKDKAYSRLLDHLDRIGEEATTPETVDFEYEEIE